MDHVLADQPPDTWDSFPLFQILNDYLRTDGKYIVLMFKRKWNIGHLLLIMWDFR